MTQNASAAIASSIPDDTLATLVEAGVQKHAARMAQDGFAQVFRLTLNEDDEGRARGVKLLTTALRNWSNAADRDEARALRLAMIVAGLDQWGLAYSQAFGLAAIPGLTELVGALRTGLEPQQEARFLQQFAAIDAAEGNAIDFKIDLRRGIHIALWHAMIASNEREQATMILTRLGGMMFALVELMPELGWRLVADALANIQIQCLADGLAAEGLAREMNEALFAALSQELPAQHRDRAMAYATQAVLRWQQARRPADGTTH
ncbi:hypothetical protein [Aromatoleum diolicum]|uniref:Uncharacterized protein n=1 Tax=Aromatoleum diolicum TaxID=75796 RepID=A0ABX1QDP1_9RHOO|nr:hypothetical protein [Aromatoleum diolicum]NMG75512.1 hypothetical protein [Aromatoleum diolicum]